MSGTARPPLSAASSILPLASWHFLSIPIRINLTAMETLLALIEQYPRFQVCGMLGIVGAAAVHMFDINLFIRILLSITLFVAWVLLGLLLEFLHSHRKKKD